MEHSANTARALRVSPLNACAEYNCVRAPRTMSSHFLSASAFVAFIRSSCSRFESARVDMTAVAQSFLREQWRRAGASQTLIRVVSCPDRPARVRNSVRPRWSAGAQGERCLGQRGARVAGALRLATDFGDHTAELHRERQAPAAVVGLWHAPPLIYRFLITRSTVHHAHCAQLSVAQPQPTGVRCSGGAPRHYHERCCDPIIIIRHQCDQTVKSITFMSARQEGWGD